MQHRHHEPTDGPAAPAPGRAARARRHPTGSWRHRGRVLVRAVVVVATVAMGVIFTGPAVEAADTGTVVVVHGLPGIEADLYLDGASSPALTSFTFRRVTDPLALQAGTHRADVRTARAPAGTAPLLSGTFTVVAGQRITVAALVDSAGRPSWLAFPDDAWSTGSPDAQVRFRHLAATGPVDLVVDGVPAVAAATNLAATAPRTPLALAAGSHVVTVVDPATGVALVPAQRVELGAGAVVNLYLTGSSSPPSLELLLQGAAGEPAATVSAAARVLPAVIRSGDSGLADRAAPSPPRPLGHGGLPVVGIAATFAALGGTTAFALARRRRVIAR